MEFSEAFSPVRAIRHGADALGRSPGPLLLGGFFMWVTAGGCNTGGNMSNLSDLGKGQSPEVTAALLAVVVGIVLIGLVLGLLAFLFRSWLHTGYIRLHRDVIATGTGTLATLVSGTDAFWRMATWKLLAGLIGAGTTIVSMIPGGVIVGVALLQKLGDVPVGVGVVVMLAAAVPVTIYVALGLSLGEYAVALEGLGAVDALDRTWELARGNRMTLLGFYIVTGLFGLLGLIACCIGMFVTRTIADVGTTEAFLLATRPEARDYRLPSELGLS